MKYTGERKSLDLGTSGAPSAAIACGPRSVTSARSFHRAFVEGAAIGLLLSTIVLGYFLVRFLERERALSPDAATYNELARGLIAAGRYGLADKGLDPTTTMVLPGWPALLALLYSVSGIRPAAGIALNYVLTALTVALLVGGVTARLGLGKRSAACLAFFLAADPGIAGVAGNLWSEAFFHLALAVIVAAACFVEETTSTLVPMLGLVGVAASLATLTRPVFLPVVISLGIATVAWNSQPGLNRWVGVPIFAVLGFFGAWAAWSVRNEARTGQFIFTDNTGFTLYTCNHLWAVSLEKGTDWWAERRQWEGTLPKKGTSEFLLRAKRSSAEAMLSPLRHPQGWMIALARGANEMLFPRGWRTANGALCSFFWGVFPLFFLAFAARARRPAGPPSWTRMDWAMLMSSLVIGFLLATNYYADFRFRSTVVVLAVLPATRLAVEGMRRRARVGTDSCNVSKAQPGSDVVARASVPILASGLRASKEEQG